MPLGAVRWKDVEHIKANLSEDKVKLILPETTKPYPPVTIITIVTDIRGFQFAVASWMQLIYPKDLLHWTIVDIGSLITDENAPLSDPRVKRLRLKNSLQKKEFPAHKTIQAVLNASPNDHLFMILECGDVAFPDTLLMKHRAISKKRCVLADALAYYDPLTNVCSVHKLFPNVPYSGCYFKKEWWPAQSSKQAVGIPYIGNVICIGSPRLVSLVEKASWSFFKEFPQPVKELIRALRFQNENDSGENVRKDNEGVPKENGSGADEKEDSL